ncbi:hypothetical protein [Agrococcus sp. ARC_14]|uniref:hypothetical protein n=1 Tax=Agrococcus sp. ARC_14 TaxID=2919927 RepID=UPI001F05C814|nr:hypothetical protein [Agrococcus sp. ARC_14]MCH1881575.1 hypothetical protein [Agrococcus sp. ARC_14]
MTATPTASQGLQHWHLPALRAVPALVVGLPLPFIQLHAPVVGLIALAVLLAGTGVAMWLGRRSVPDGTGRWPAVVAVWSAFVALVAVVLAIVAPTATLLGLAVALWAIPAGLVELQGWARMRSVAEPRTVQLRRDWLAVGGFTVLLGLVFAFLRDPVTLVGLLGAYAVIVGVFHAVAALSARPARTTTTQRSDA